MSFANWLKSKGACTEGYAAHHHQTEQKFWDTCTRADWMLWVAERKYGTEGWPNHVGFVRIAAACARRALVHVPAGEDCPRLAIEAAEAWADNPCDKTRAAAWDAARAAWAAGAAGAAWAAGAAAWAAGDAAGAAWDAARAAWAAWAAGDAGDAENTAQADEIRRIWPKVGV